MKKNGQVVIIIINVMRNGGDDRMTSEALLRFENRSSGFLLKIQNVDKTSNEFRRIEEFGKFKINVL
jgi:hypothetical protein